jgi:hypothetical protein
VTLNQIEGAKYRISRMKTLISQQYFSIEIVREREIISDSFVSDFPEIIQSFENAVG